jgi:predicted nucleotidyltransferase
MHGVRRLEIFGSILRGDSNGDRGDVNALVEFSQQAVGSFSNFLAALKESLEAVIGRSVELGELDAIRKRRLRYYIDKHKSPVYIAG